MGVIARNRRVNGVGRIGRPPSATPIEIRRERWRSKYVERLERMGLVKVLVHLPIEAAESLKHWAKTLRISRGAFVARLLAKYQPPESAWPAVRASSAPANGGGQASTRGANAPQGARSPSTAGPSFESPFEPQEEQQLLFGR